MEATVPQFTFTTKRLETGVNSIKHLKENETPDGMSAACRAIVKGEPIQPLIYGRGIRHFTLINLNCPLSLGD